MKKNLDQYLIKFLSRKGYLFLDNEFNELVSYRFSLVGNQIYVTTSNPDIICKLGDFEQINDVTYKLNYLYKIDCLIKSKATNDTIIQVIQKLHPKGDIEGRLLEYLKSS